MTYNLKCTALKDGTKLKLSVISVKHHGCPVRRMNDMKKSTALNRKDP